MSDKFRGYKIKNISEVWRFEDTGETVSETWENRPCGHCKLFNTLEGHDGCLGILPDVMNACCGHGDSKQAYIQFSNGECIHGEEGKNYIDKILNEYNTH